MSNAGVRITPKADLRLEDVKDRLAAAHWNLIGLDDTGPIVALGEFTSVDEQKKALAVVEEVGDSITLLESAEVKDLDDSFKTGIAPPEEAGNKAVELAKVVLEVPNASDGKAPAAAQTPDRYSGPPNIPQPLLNLLSDGDRSRVVSKYIEEWLHFATSREEQAAWKYPSREASLLAAIEVPYARTAVAGDLLTEEVEASKQRTKMLAELVGMAAAMKEQVAAWTALAGKVPGLLGFSITLGAVFVGWSLLLVHEGKLNGLELALLAFVFALAAISPATLLLVGRPLKGMDDWTPDKLFGADKDDKKASTGKTDDAGTSTDGTKPGDGKTGDAKPGDTSEKPAAS